MRKLIFNLRNSKRVKLILRRFVMAFLFLYIFSLPAFSYRSVFNYVSYALMLFLTISTLAYCFLYSEISFNVLLTFLLLFCVWAFLGTVLYSQQFRDWLTLILLSITLIVFTLSFKCISNDELLFLFIVFAMFAFAIYFVIYYRNDFLSLIGGKNIRLGRYFANENAIGSFMTIGIGTSFYLIFERFKKRYLFLLLPIAAFFVVGFSTGSKAFLLSTFIILIVFLLLNSKKHPFISISIFVGIIIAIILLFQLPFLSSYKDRIIYSISGLFGGATDTSTITRKTWQEYGFCLGSKNLVTGYGCNGFSIYSGVGSYTHSNISEVFCDFGIVGLILFYLTPIICTIKTFKNKQISFFVIGFCVYFILTGFLTVNYYSKSTFLLMALLVHLTEKGERNGKIFVIYRYNC